MKFGERKKLEAKEITEESVEVTVIPPVDEMEDLNSTGFSMIRHPESGFAIVTLKFNPVTMKATVESLRQVGNSRMEAETAFKMEIGRYFHEQEMKSK